MDQKTMSVRLPAEPAAELDEVAAVDNVSSAEAIRQAVLAHVDKRRRDPEFQARLEERMGRNRRLYERLSET